MSKVIISIQTGVSFSLGQVTLRRALLYWLCTLLHLIILILYWKFPLKLYRYYALLVMMSFQTFLINDPDDLPIGINNSEGIRNVIGVFNQVMLATVFLNGCWLISSVGIAIMLWSTYVYYVIVLEFSVFPFIIQFIVFTALHSYMTYFSESILKKQFVEARENQVMH